MARADFAVENHGTIFTMRPLNRKALVWLKKHTDGTWLGNTLGVEHRFIEALVEGAMEHGFGVV